MAKKDEFKLAKLPIEAQDKSIKKDDFKLVAKDTKIYDKRFNTKPTTFFKDCLKRFSKNKSSVVAAWILGVLLLLSIIVPFFSVEDSIHDVSKPHTDIGWLEPRLFSKGNFWSGKKNYVDVPVDENGNPSSTFDTSAISEKVVNPNKEYSNYATEFGSGGYVQYIVYSSAKENTEYSLGAGNVVESFDFGSDHLTVKNFVALSAEDLANSDEETKTLPQGYESAQVKLQLSYKIEIGTNQYESAVIDLTEYAKSHNITEENEIDVNAIFDAKASEDNYLDKVAYEPTFRFTVLSNPGKNICALIKSFKINADSANRSKLEAISFNDGNECLVRDVDSDGYWANLSSLDYTDKRVYLAKVTLASFKYDTYQAALGTTYVDLSRTDLNDYTNGDEPKLKFSYQLEYVEGTPKIKEGSLICEILDKSCPIVEPFTISDITLNSAGAIVSVHAKVNKYSYNYGLDKMPIFLMGTDKSGRDMFINVFQGLRTSLLLGVGTTIVCFVFGLIWGSISGYFGGAVDLIMERFTDILSGVPWIVVMTLVIIKVGDASFGVFALALCLTGWIGTAATTRTQFYRFRGREYVLASRTLGASHGRLIAKHILPNAMGTIITSAVLMVPSVIFSEATLSYLGLAKIGNGDGLSSLGVILSDNQVELTNHPYLLIFPSVIIALIMISFNLAGNGLRDAVNPSLKGEGE